MAGGNVNKIKFNVNGKDFTLRLGEDLKNEMKNLKLGSIWKEIDANDNGKLEKDEFNMFRKLDSFLNKEGKWENLDSFVKEFEKSGKNLNAFLNEKLGLTPKLATKSEVKTDNSIKVPVKSMKEMELDLNLQREIINDNLEVEKFLEQDTKRLIKEVKYDLDVSISKGKEDTVALTPKYNQTYKVESGDTLGKIAIAFLQEEGIDKPNKAQIMKKIGEIMAMNPQIKSSHIIYDGMEIKKPTPEPPDAVKPALKPVPTDTSHIPAPRMTMPNEFPVDMKPNVTRPVLADPPAATLDMSLIPTVAVGTRMADITDGSGNIIGTAHYDKATGQFKCALLEEEDANGNDTKLVYYDVDGNLCSTTEYTYDASDRELTETHYNASNEAVSHADYTDPDKVKTYVYTGDPDKVKVVVEDASGTLLYEEVGFENSDEWELKRTYPDGKEEVYMMTGVGNFIDVFYLDGSEEKGVYDVNIINQTSTTPAYEVERDENGKVISYIDESQPNMVRKENYNPVADELEKVVDETYYDASAGVVAGKIDQRIEQDKNGEITEWKQYEYDTSSGDYKREILYDSNGKVVGYQVDSDQDGDADVKYDRYGNEIWRASATP